MEFECKQITSVGSAVIDGSSYNYLDVSNDSPGTGTIRALYTGALASSLSVFRELVPETNRPDVERG